MADSAIEEIKRRIDVVDLISQTVQLQRAGRSFKGLCPFHSEKTPSFHVSPERGSWHCFGCGEGGDIFSFVQRRDNVEFVEALRMLAEQADVELERSSRPDPTRQQRRERLHALLESAALYYRAALTGTRWPAARTYFEGRGISAETSERFGLGYAEPSGRGLAQHLVQAGFGLDEAVAAGALGQAENGRTYDRFRDRVIFPIRDPEGRMIGFGGRTLGDQLPKYLNSPQTDLFDKGGSLYALDQARAAIREARQAVVVEGYMDALIAHQHGFRNVVATLGTAITERHMEVLRRLAQEVVLALDADAAGQRATLRGLEVARESLADESPTILRVRGLGRFFGDRRTQVKAMILPTGRDPDEVIREDPTLWKRLAGQALPVVDFVLESLGRQHDLTSAAGRREAAREAMTVIQDLPDPVERAHYIQRLARLLNVREEFLLQAAQTRPRRAPTPEAGAALPGSELESARRYEDRLEDHVLALSLRAPGDAPRPEANDFESAIHRAILEYLTGGSERRDPALALDSLVHELGPAVEPTIGRVRAADEENGRLTPEEATKELRVRILELRKLRLFRQHQALNSVLAEAERLSAAERQEYQTRLAHLTANLGDVFAQQRELGAVGTTSWSVRRGQEVLGG